MFIIFGIGAIVFAIKNILNYISGYESDRYRFISMALTSLTILSFYIDVALQVTRKDIAAIMDITPTASVMLLICTIASISINSVSLIFKKK